MSEDNSNLAVGEVQLGSAAEATVMAYHELAVDPDKRLHLALDDTCLQFLSLVIGNGNNNLVSKALDTLEALSSSVECRAPMAATFGVLHSLKASVEEENDHTEEMKNRAAELFTCLNFAYHQQRAVRKRSKPASSSPATESSSQQLKDSDSDVLPSSSTAADNRLSNAAADSVDKKITGIEHKPSSEKKSAKEDNKSEKEVENRKKDDDKDRGGLVRSDSIESNCSSLSLSSCSQPSQTHAHRSSSTTTKEDKPGHKYYRDPKHRTRLVSLYVKGMLTPHERYSVEQALVRVRGVISLVFDPSRGRVACRVRRVLDLSKLGSAIDNLRMGLVLYQIVTKNKGEEIKIPLSQGHSKDTGDADEGKDVDIANKSVEASSDSELPDYLPEDDDDDECKPENDPTSAVAPTGLAFKEAASSLFSAAASLLQQSFYW